MKISPENKQYIKDIAELVGTKRYNDVLSMVLLQMKMITEDTLDGFEVSARNGVIYYNYDIALRYAIEGFRQDESE